MLLQGGFFRNWRVAGALEDEALREHVGLRLRGTKDFFDTLVALDMLEHEDGRYANTTATEFFLDRAKPS
jgi:hypothetical protein